MGKTFKIGIDARFFAEAGPGRYVKNILEQLEKIDQNHEYYVFLTPKGYTAYNPTGANFKKIVTTAKWYSFAEQTTFLWQVMRESLDLFYVPHFNIPLLYPGKIVTAIPDIIMHTFSTERGTTLPKPYFRFKKYVYKLVLKFALLRSIKVIVPTYDVYNDITSHYPEVSKNKFLVAYEGVDPVFMQQASTGDGVLKEFGVEKDRYLLYVSSMYEHKNVERLIAAFALLVKNYNYAGKLVLIGKKDKFAQRIYDLVVQQNLRDRVILPGMKRYITDAEVMVFRKNASLYVFPSLKEGFSLTPLEAQYIGLACVISNISCHREVFEDSVCYFDPTNVDDIAAKIDRVLKDPALKESLIQKGYERVKKYNWEDTAKLTLQVFNEALDSKTL